MVKITNYPIFIVKKTYIYVDWVFKSDKSNKLAVGGKVI